MRIGLLISGGTFDSDQDDEGDNRRVGAKVPAERYAPLISRVKRQCSEVEIRLVASPRRIDSSQLTPRWIQCLTHNIQNAFYGPVGVDRVIVAVGTDTLSYVVPAVATALGSIPRKSVAFVSGMNPWHVDESDALQNLLDACGIMRSGSVEGVMMVSGRRVYGPYNLVKFSHDALDPFRQVQLHPRRQWQELPSVLEERLGQGGCALAMHNPAPPITLQMPIDAPSLSRAQTLAPTVAQVQVYPGLRARMVTTLAQDPEIKHVILRCYANGTAPVSEAGSAYNLADAVGELRDRGVMTYAVSQHLGAVAPEHYAVCGELDAAGCLYVTRFTAETLHAILLVLSASQTPTQAQATLQALEYRLS